MTTRVIPEQAPSTLASLDIGAPSGSRPSMLSHRSSSAHSSIHSTQSSNADSSTRRQRRRQLSQQDDQRATAAATAAITFLAQFHNSPASMVRALSARRGRQRAASQAASATVAAATTGRVPSESEREREPSLALSNGSTPTESEGPSSPGSLFPSMAGDGRGSEESLQGLALAPLIQSPGTADISESEALETIEKAAPRGRTMDRAAAVLREGPAAESLLKMLAGA